MSTQSCVKCGLVTLAMMILFGCGDKVSSTESSMPSSLVPSSMLFSIPSSKSSSPSPSPSPTPSSNETGSIIGTAALESASSNTLSAAQAEEKQQNHVPRPFKGVYVPNRLIGSDKWIAIQKAVDMGTINAVVLDLKSDWGVTQLSTDSNKAPAAPSERIKRAVDELKGKGVYVIGRLITFKDPFLAENRPELAIQAKAGGIWKDHKGVAWLDPYNRRAWEYNIELAKAAANAGFDEIQFDYVRFPENAQKVDQEVIYHNPHGLSKVDAISGFLQEARRSLKPLNIHLSADVFGMVISAKDDLGIGQDWVKISRNVDFICPMIYPSHYGKGIYGVDQPDLQPYLIVQKAVKHALSRNRSLDQPAEIRPWLQDFTAQWVKPHQVYGKYQVEEQIKALQELGVDQFLLWNSSAAYSFK